MKSNCTRSAFDAIVKPTAAALSVEFTEMELQLGYEQHIDVPNPLEACKCWHKTSQHELAKEVKADTVKRAKTLRVELNAAFIDALTARYMHVGCTGACKQVADNDSWNPKSVHARVAGAYVCKVDLGNPGHAGAVTHKVDLGNPGRAGAISRKVDLGNPNCVNEENVYEVLRGHHLNYANMIQQTTATALAMYAVDDPFHKCEAGDAAEDIVNACGLIPGVSVFSKLKFDTTRCDRAVKYAAAMDLAIFSPILFVKLYDEYANLNFATFVKTYKLLVKHLNTEQGSNWTDGAAILALRATCETNLARLAQAPSPF